MVFVVIRARACTLYVWLLEEVLWGSIRKSSTGSGEGRSSRRRHVSLPFEVDGTLTLPVATSAVGVRRAKAALSSGCKPHPAIAPAGSNRISHGGNEVAEAFD